MSRIIAAIARRFVTFFSCLRSAFSKMFQFIISRKWLKRFTTLVLAVLVLLLAYSLYCGYERRHWRAVFLTNGQTYFGRFVPSIFANYDTLTQIYYLKTEANTPTSPTALPQSAVTVVKFGNEVHGPQDVMEIPRGTILFWEDLRDDSGVVKTINNSFNPKKPNATK